MGKVYLTNGSEGVLPKRSKMMALLGSLFLWGGIIFGDAYSFQHLYKIEKNPAYPLSKDISVIQDYGSFGVASLKAGQRDILRDKGVLIEPLILSPIRLGNGMEIATQGTSPFRTTQVFPAFYILQYLGPIKATWIKEVETLGAKPLPSAYFPNYALLYWIPSREVMEKLKSLPFIHWIGFYEPAYKTTLSLAHRGGEEKELKLRVKVRDEGSIQRVAKVFQKEGIDIVAIHRIPHYLATPSLIVFAKEALIPRIVALPEVWWVEEMVPVKLSLATARELHQIGVGDGCSGTLSEVPVWAQGITGAGSTPSCGASKGSEQLVGVIDTTFNSPDFDCDLGIPNCTIMKYVEYNPSAASPCDIKNTVNACISGHAHGSGSAGVILGNGDQSDTDADGDGQTPMEGCSNKGMAFGARFWGVSCDETPADLACLNNCHAGDYTITLTNFFQASYADGSRLSNHSYSASVFGNYDGGSEVVDIWAYDNDNNPTNGVTQDYLWFFAAGNDGPAAGSIGSPATAKNDVTGAAVYNGVEGSCWSCDAAPCSEDKLVCYSSRGPTDDGRYGPEVAGASQYVTAPTDSSGYQAFNGTSCATPSLTAQGVLIRDWLEGVVGINPSANLVKALLLNSGEYISQPSENLPGTGQGWGRPVLTNLCDDFSLPNCNQVRSLWAEDTFTFTGETSEMDLFVTDSTTPLKCILTWMDPPNLAGGGALINDLNLKVTDPNGIIYLGNDFTGAWSNAGGTTYDTVNNSEGVRIQNPATGLWTIEVLAGNIPQSPQPWAVTCSGKITDQSSDGIVRLNKTIYSCTDTLEIRVSDADLQGKVTQDVTLWSTYETISETVTLTEDPADSGIFKGTFPLTPNPPANGDGFLSVQHGNTITLQYMDADDGQGGANVPKQDTATTDCQGPVITNVQATTITNTSATIIWNTDEMSTSIVYYGTSPPPSNQGTSSGMTTTHSVSLTGLTDCTTYSYDVVSCDPYGNCTTDDNGGAYYTFTTTRMDYLFYDDVEEGNQGWTADPPWAISNEASHSLSNAWTDSPGTDYGNNLNISLTSPVFDLSGVTFATLKFYHIYSLEIGYDYGYLEATTDGTTWDTLASYNGSQTSWIEEVIPLGAPYAGSPTFQFRFRLNSDAAVVKDGWHIDDLRIETYPSCSYGTIDMDKDYYTCNDTITVTVTDLDLNQDPSIQETATVTVKSTTEPIGEMVTVTEKGVNSPQFGGTINITGDPPSSDGLLSLSDGDTITAEYVDADDGSGNARTATDTATADCLLPVISNVQAINITGNSADITWDTNENADSFVTYDTVAPPTANKASDATMVTSHSVPITGLTECTDYFYYVQSTDLAGNQAMDTNGGAYYSFKTGPNIQPTYDSIDTPMRIPDGPNGLATSTITVSDNKTVMDVNVTVNITHTYDGDLLLELIAPDGTVVTLSNRHGGAGDNYTNTIFDDEATTPIANGTPPFTGSFIPDSPLSSVDGINASGNWQLRITDNAPLDQGTIDNWHLSLTYPATTCGPPPVPDGSGTTTPMTVQKATADGSQLTLTWDTQCSSSANILYGDLASLSSYALLGSQCDIGSPETWNVGNTTNIWFVLVTDDGAGTESSWGQATQGERNGTHASNQCGNTERDNTGVCP